MKTSRNTTRLQRCAVLAGLGAVGLILAGCVVTSVYPFYTDKDLAFEPSLLGEWVGADEAPKPGEFVRVERLGKLGYVATVFTADSTNSVICHLFRLNKQLFLDSCPTNDSLDHIPVHQVSKVTQLQPELETADLKYDWLEALLKQNPKALRHTRVREKADESGDGRIVLTADTAELQKFLRAHLTNTNAWQQPSRVKRRN